MSTVYERAQGGQGGAMGIQSNNQRKRSDIITHTALIEKRDDKFTSVTTDNYLCIGGKYFESFLLSLEQFRALSLSVWVTLVFFSDQDPWA